MKIQIKNWLKRRLGVPEIEFGLARLARSGFEPKLIFDVGAYQGDFARTCRSIWNQSEIACFEVQPEGLQRIKALDPKVGAWPFLLGASVRENVPLNLAKTASSVLQEHSTQSFPIGHFPMRTVDDMVQNEFRGRAPELLKLDVQGYELEVLRGAENSLAQVEVILTEVNLLDIHRGVPLLGEVMAWLASRHWLAYDICGLTRRPLDQALWQADMIFLPENSPLRANKRWI